MLLAKVNRVFGDPRLVVRSLRVPGIRIWVKAGVVAAGDVQRDAVALVEDNRRRPQIDPHADNFARLHDHFAIEAFTVSGSDNAVGQKRFVAIRVDIHQLGNKVGVWGIRRPWAAVAGTSILSG